MMSQEVSAALIAFISRNIFLIYTLFVSHVNQRYAGNTGMDYNDTAAS